MNYCFCINVLLAFTLHSDVKVSPIHDLGCHDFGIIVFDVSAHDYLICLEFLQERAWRSIACYSYSMYVLDFTKTGTGMPSLLLSSLHEFIVT